MKSNTPLILTCTAALALSMACDQQTQGPRPASQRVEMIQPGESTIALRDIQYKTAPGSNIDETYGSPISVCQFVEGGESLAIVSFTGNYTGKERDHHCTGESPFYEGGDFEVDVLAIIGGRELPSRMSVWMDGGLAGDCSSGLVVIRHDTYPYVVNCVGLEFGEELTANPVDPKAAEAFAALPKTFEDWVEVARPVFDSYEDTCGASTPARYNVYDHIASNIEDCETGVDSTPPTSNPERDVYSPDD